METQELTTQTDIKNIFELISLGATWPTILTALLVVVLWYFPFLEAMKSKSKLSLHWFIIGVFVGFLGSILDNAYWFLAWSAVYLDSDWQDFLMYNGVYFNVFSRQLCGIIAGYCHIRSALEHSESVSLRLLNWLFLLSAIGGVLYCVILILMKAN